MGTALVALGANLGDREAALRAALARLAQRPQIESLEASSTRATRAAGGPADQPGYLNAAARLKTSLSPRELFTVLGEIEASLGRRRDIRWGPRTIDLDLLLYDDVRIDTPELVLPHPRMSFRRFVLEPAAEVAADMLHPASGWTIGQLLAHLNSAAPFVAMHGSRRLAQALCERFAAEPILFSAEMQANETQPREISPPCGPVAKEALSEGCGPWRRAVAEYARRLAADRWPPGDRLRIGDVWLDLFSEGPCAEQLDDAARAAIRAAARPKLAIVWQPPLEEDGLAGPRESGQSACQAFEHVWRVAREPGHGPVLYLETPRFDEALREAVAAIEAMQ